MIDRRKFLGMAAGAGASLALTPQLLRALQQQSSGKLIQRAIPSTGEMLPVISFDPRRESDTAGMKEILKAMIDHGGKVVDFPHGGGEAVARAAAGELGVQDSLFWTTEIFFRSAKSVPVLPGAIEKVAPAAVRAAVEAKLAAFKVPRIDLVMVSASSDVTTQLAVLREMKKEGKVRYMGVQDLTPPPYPPEPMYARFESIMRNEAIDFIGTDYSVGWRGVEQRILPLAIERKIGFMAHFSFDRGRLFQRVNGMPLPEWAAEFDAKTWAQFFLKYVISHPGVVVARAGTTKAAHMVDNLGGGMGRLPNEATRKRMAAFVDALPARQNASGGSSQGRMTSAPPQAQASVALSPAILDRYVGAYQHAAVGTILAVRREGENLLLDVQDSGRREMVFVARSETRFASSIFTIEFHLDGQGKVTGATWETASGGSVERIALDRK